MFSWERFWGEGECGGSLVAVKGRQPSQFSPGSAQDRVPVCSSIIEQFWYPTTKIRAPNQCRLTKLLLEPLQHPRYAPLHPSKVLLELLWILLALIIVLVLVRLGLCGCVEG